MVHFRLHSVADIIVVELIVPGLREGPQLEEMFERFHELIGRSQSKRMIIDLSRVQFIASRALALLVVLRQIVESHKGKFTLCGLREKPQQVFRFSGLDRLFTFHDTRDEALASFDAPVEC